MDNIVLENFIKSLTSVEPEQDLLLKQAKIFVFIVESIINKKVDNTRLDNIETNIANIAAEQAKLMEDNLRVVQSAEMLSKISTTRIDEFNAVTKKILEEPIVELKLAIKTFEEFVVEKGVSNTFTIVSNGTSRNLAQLLDVTVNQAKKNNLPHIFTDIVYSSELNDVDKRRYFADGLKFLEDNKDDKLITNAGRVLNKLRIAYEDYKREGK